MATPRKHWFRVQDSILHETWSIELKGVAVNLMAYLNTRWAREGLTAEQACSARLSPAACMLVTGSQRLVKARSTLRRLAVETQLTVSEDGADTLVCWRKFAEVQGLAAPKTPESRPRVAPSASAPAPAPAGREEQEQEGECEREPAAPAPTAEPVGLVVAGAPPKRKPRPRARLPVTPPPEVLAPADRERLIAWCERIYPDLGPELATISASTLDYWRGDGRMKADWLAVVRDRVRWTAERRGLRPRPPPAVADPVDLSDPALGGQPLFADEVASG